ncbi:amidase [soil metagenome]
MSAPSGEPCDLDIIGAASLLRSRKLSAVELLDSVLMRLDQTEETLHAYVTLQRDEARHEATACDEELAKGETRGPLHGIPVGIKDIYDVRGVPTRCGSKSRESIAPSERDSDVVAQLRAAGAIILGKTTTQEFAAGVVSDPTRNPWDPSRIPGGSSGGSAAAVSAGSALGAMGSDTGGSIRIPASLCGIVGLKPTYGTVSTRGIYPLSWSLDTAGPLAKTVDDAELLFNVIRGGNSASKASRRNTQFRVGVPRGHFFERLQPGVAAAIETSISALKTTGVVVVDTPWPGASRARACSFIINRVETAAVHKQFLTEHGNLYGEQLRSRIESSALFPATGYTTAIQARRQLNLEARALFAKYKLDALLTPATPGTAARAKHTFVNYPDGTEEHVSMAYTRLSMPFNVTGQPALSIPCGLDELGLPVGLQLAGRPLDERRLCDLGRLAEATLAFPVTLPAPVAKLAGAADIAQG